MRTVILLEGINDIGFAGMPDSGCSDPNNPDVTAAQIEAGYRTFITEAHAKGVKIYAGTLMPFMGSNSVYGANSASASTGDGLHPGDVGYEAMADAIPLGFVG